MSRYVVPFALLPLAALGGWLAPRLSAETAVPEPLIEAAAPAGPCMRWGALECCYVDESTGESEAY